MPRSPLVLAKSSFLCHTGFHQASDVFDFQLLAINVQGETTLLWAQFRVVEATTLRDPAAATAVLIGQQGGDAAFSSHIMSLSILSHVVCLPTFPIHILTLDYLLQFCLNSNRVANMNCPFCQAPLLSAEQAVYHICDRFSLAMTATGTGHPHSADSSQMTAHMGVFDATFWRSTSTIPYAPFFLSLWEVAFLVVFCIQVVFSNPLWRLQWSSMWLSLPSPGSPGSLSASAWSCTTMESSLDTMDRYLLQDP